MPAGHFFSSFFNKLLKIIVLIKKAIVVYLDTQVHDVATLTSFLLSSILALKLAELYILTYLVNYEGQMKTTWSLHFFSYNSSYILTLYLNC
jgi:hypothetical protein